MNKIKIEQDLNVMKKNYNAILEEWLGFVDIIKTDHVVNSNIDGSIKEINKLYDFVAGKSLTTTSPQQLTKFINIFLNANLLYDSDYNVCKNDNIIKLISQSPQKNFYIFKIDELEKYINTLETMNKSKNEKTLAIVKSELETSGSQNLASYLSPVKPIFLIKSLIKTTWANQNMLELLKPELIKYDHELQSWLRNSNMYKMLIDYNGDANNNLKILQIWATTENDDKKNDEKNITLWNNLAGIINEFYNKPFHEIYKNINNWVNNEKIGNPVDTQECDSKDTFEKLIKKANNSGTSNFRLFNPGSSPNANLCDTNYLLDTSLPDYYYNSLKRMENLPELSDIENKFINDILKKAPNLNDIFKNIKIDKKNDLSTTNYDKFVKLIKMLNEKFNSVFPVIKCNDVKIKPSTDLKKLYDNVVKLDDNVVKLDDVNVKKIDDKSDDNLANYSPLDNAIENYNNHYIEFMENNKENNNVLNVLYKDVDFLDSSDSFNCSNAPKNSQFESQPLDLQKPSTNNQDFAYMCLNNLIEKLIDNIQNYITKHNNLKDAICNEWKKYKKSVITTLKEKIGEEFIDNLKGNIYQGVKNLFDPPQSAKPNADPNAVLIRLITELYTLPNDDSQDDSPKKCDEKLKFIIDNIKAKNNKYIILSINFKNNKININIKINTNDIVLDIDMTKEYDYITGKNILNDDDLKNIEIAIPDIDIVKKYIENNLNGNIDDNEVKCKIDVLYNDLSLQRRVSKLIDSIKKSHADGIFSKIDVKIPEKDVETMNEDELQNKFKELDNYRKDVDIIREKLNTKLKIPSFPTKIVNYNDKKIDELAYNVARSLDNFNEAEDIFNKYYEKYQINSKLPSLNFTGMKLNINFCSGSNHEQVPYPFKNSQQTTVNFPDKFESKDFFKKFIEINTGLHDNDWSILYRTRNQYTNPSNNKHKSFIMFPNLISYNGNKSCDNNNPADINNHLRKDPVLWTLPSFKKCTKHEIIYIFYTTEDWLLLPSESSVNKPNGLANIQPFNSTYLGSGEVGPKTAMKGTFVRLKDNDIVVFAYITSDFKIHFNEPISDKLPRQDIQKLIDENFANNNIKQTPWMIEGETDKDIDEYPVRDFADLLFKDITTELDNLDKAPTDKLEEDYGVIMNKIYDKLTEFVNKYILINYKSNEPKYPEGKLYQQFSVFTNLFFSILNAFTDFNIGDDGLVNEVDLWKSSYLFNFWRKGETNPTNFPKIPFKPERERHRVPKGSETEWKDIDLLKNWYEHNTTISEMNVNSISKNQIWLTFVYPWYNNDLNIGSAPIDPKTPDKKFSESDDFYNAQILHIYNKNITNPPRGLRNRIKFYNGRILWSTINKYPNSEQTIALYKISDNLYWPLLPKIKLGGEGKNLIVAEKKVGGDTVENPSGLINSSPPDTQLSDNSLEKVKHVLNGWKWGEQEDAKEYKWPSQSITDLIKPHIVRLTVTIYNAIFINRYNKKNPEKKIDLWEPETKKSIQKNFGYAPFQSIFQSIYASYSEQPTAYFRDYFEGGMHNNIVKGISDIKEGQIMYNILNYNNEKKIFKFLRGKKNMGFNTISSNRNVQRIGECDNISMDNYYKYNGEKKDSGLVKAFKQRMSEFVGGVKQITAIRTNETNVNKICDIVHFTDDDNKYYAHNNKVSFCCGSKSEDTSEPFNNVKDKEFLIVGDEFTYILTPKDNIKDSFQNQKFLKDIGHDDNKVERYNWEGLINYDSKNVDNLSKKKPYLIKYIKQNNDKDNYDITGLIKFPKIEKRNFTQKPIEGSETNRRFYFNKIVYNIFSALTHDEPKGYFVPESINSLFDAEKNDTPTLVWYNNKYHIYYDDIFLCVDSQFIDCIVNTEAEKQSPLFTEKDEITFPEDGQTDCPPPPQNNIDLTIEPVADEEYTNPWHHKLITDKQIKEAGKKLKSSKKEEERRKEEEDRRIAEEDRRIAEQDKQKAATTIQKTWRGNVARKDAEKRREEVKKRREEEEERRRKQEEEEKKTNTIKTFIGNSLEDVVPPLPDDVHDIHKKIYDFIDNNKRDFIFLYDDTKMKYQGGGWRTIRDNKHSNTTLKNNIIFNNYLPFLNTLGQNPFDDWYMEEIYNYNKEKGQAHVTEWNKKKFDDRYLFSLHEIEDWKLEKQNQTDVKITNEEFPKSNKLNIANDKNPLFYKLKFTNKWEHDNSNASKSEYMVIKLFGKFIYLPTMTAKKNWVKLYYSFVKADKLNILMDSKDTLPPPPSEKNNNLYNSINCLPNVKVPYYKNLSHYFLFENKHFKLLHPEHPSYIFNVVVQNKDTTQLVNEKTTNTCDDVGDAKKNFEIIKMKYIKDEGEQFNLVSHKVTPSTGLNSGVRNHRHPIPIKTTGLLAKYTDVWNNKHNKDYYSLFDLLTLSSSGNPQVINQLPPHNSLTEEMIKYMQSRVAEKKVRDNSPKRIKSKNSDVNENAVKMELNFTIKNDLDNVKIKSSENYKNWLNVKKGGVKNLPPALQIYFEEITNSHDENNDSDDENNDSYDENNDSDDEKNKKYKWFQKKYKWFQDEENFVSYDALEVAVEEVKKVKVAVDAVDDVDDVEEVKEVKDAIKNAADAADAAIKALEIAAKTAKGYSAAIENIEKAKDAVKIVATTAAGEMEQVGTAGDLGEIKITFTDDAVKAVEEAVKSMTLAKETYPPYPTYYTLLDKLLDILKNADRLSKQFESQRCEGKYETIKRDIKVELSVISKPKASWYQLWWDNHMGHFLMGDYNKNGENCQMPSSLTSRSFDINFRREVYQEFSPESKKSSDESNYLQKMHVKKYHTVYSYFKMLDTLADNIWDSKEKNSSFDRIRNLVDKIIKPPPQGGGGGVNRETIKQVAISNFITIFNNVVAQDNRISSPDETPTVLNITHNIPINSLILTDNIMREHPSVVEHKISFNEDVNYVDIYGFYYILANTKTQDFCDYDKIVSFQEAPIYSKITPESMYLNLFHKYFICTDAVFEGFEKTTFYNNNKQSLKEISTMLIKSNKNPLKGDYRNYYNQKISTGGGNFKTIEPRKKTVKRNPVKKYTAKKKIKRKLTKKGKIRKFSKKT